MDTNELIQNFEAKINELKGNVAKSEDLTALKNDFEAIKNSIVDKSVVDDLTQKLTDAGLRITELETKGTPENANSLVKELTEKKEALKGIIEGKKGEIEIKALTNRASVDGNTNAYVLPDIGQLGVVRRALYDVLPKTVLSNNANDNGVIKYHDWDEATTVRAAEMVAEGAPFDESTAKFKEYTLPLRKIGDTLPVTEEFKEDVSLAAAELERFLDVNVQTKVDSQIINGDNTGQELKGLLVSVPTYVPAGAGITFPNIKDLVRKMRTAIIKPRGSKYNVDIVVMNSDTFDKYYLAKDEDGNYLFDENGRIAGLTVVEDNNMPDNQLVVGDRRFARIFEKAGVVISEGMINDQFVEDTMTIKARKRLAMLIRTVDATGFLKCTDITAALAILDDAPSV
jgi:HK97 family phage major capsid protein